MDGRRIEVRLPEIITVSNLQIFQAVLQPTQPSLQTLLWGFIPEIKAAEV
jgi:hypothetical protein